MPNCSFIDLSTVYSCPTFSTHALKIRANYSFLRYELMINSIVLKFVCHYPMNKINDFIDVKVGKI